MFVSEQRTTGQGLKGTHHRVSRANPLRWSGASFDEFADRLTVRRVEREPEGFDALRQHHALADPALTQDVNGRAPTLA